MFRWLRWRSAKKRFKAPPVYYPPAHIKVSLRGHKTPLEDVPPDTGSYEKLASVWDQYAALWTRDYGQFLHSAAQYFGQSIKTVLDVACGTGLLTRQLAGRVESVVGLDASTAMLNQARLLTKASNVCFVQADFRRFNLNKTFDAVVCGGDSLNYVEKPDEVADVFRCVGRHLHPNGLLVLDVINEESCLALAGTTTIVTVGLEQFAQYHFYNPATRTVEARVVFNDAIERHRRIPIEQSDIWRAADEAGLVVKDQFRSENWPPRQYYVVQRPAAKA